MSENHSQPQESAFDHNRPLETPQSTTGELHGNHSQRQATPMRTHGDLVTQSIEEQRLPDYCILCMKTPTNGSRYILRRPVISAADVGRS